MDAKTKELNLLLIYLTGWNSEDAKESGKTVFRAWKYYDFDILDQLENENMLRQHRSTVILTPQGMTKAQQLRTRYF